jgi:hypothetical protein
LTRKIAELNLLLRTAIELPVGLELATEEFREGWNFVRPGNARRLGKKVKARGWNFIKIADGELRSGVGDTSQKAIASALKLALRRVSSHFNAVEVERIELTQYPWFCLARIRVYPYRIQEGAFLPVSDEAPPLPIHARPKRSLSQADELFPHFGSAMPMMKELLISSGASTASSRGEIQ